MRRGLLVSLLAACALAGCGGTHTVTVTRTVTTPATSSPATVVQTATAQIASCAATKSIEAPCSAIHPEDSSGLRESFVEGTPPVGLTGSSIEVDNFGAEQTASFENVYKASYCPEPDPAYGWAIPTRGFGETGRGITRSSRCISHSEAVRNLRYLLDADYCYPLRSMGVNFSHLQTDALCDLSYNAGPGSLYDIEGYLKARNWSGACAVMKARWSSANGEFLSGLYHRRSEECGWLFHSEPVCTGTCLRHARERTLRSDTAKLGNERRYRTQLISNLEHAHCTPHSRRHYCEIEVGHAAGAAKRIRSLDGQIGTLKRELR